MRYIVWTVLVIGLGCSGGSPPTTSGLVLYANATELVVQHDQTMGRVVPGVAHYAVDERVAVTAVPAGAEINVWLEQDGTHPVKVEVVHRPSVAAPVPPSMTGVVVRVDGPRVTVDHDPIPGVMDAMVMSFGMNRERAAGLRTGDRIESQLISSSYGYQLAEVRVIGEGEGALRDDIRPLQPGDSFPLLEIDVEDGTTIIVGEGQDRPTLLTYLYTTCPDPTFCPATVTRLQGLQPEIRKTARMVAITIDPEHDTLPVLAAYSEQVGAESDTWRFGRLAPVDLQRVALLGGLGVTVRGGRITHQTRMLILDADGRLVERYDDNDWPLERVVGQLRGGSQ